jgi:antitoxin ParD1/3/4
MLNIMRATMNISLPRPLKRWVEDQISGGGYSTASEFVREVLRREQARARVDARLLEALDSGPATPMTRQDWQRIRRKGLKLAAARKKR